MLKGILDTLEIKKNGQSGSNPSDKLFPSIELYKLDNNSSRDSTSFFVLQTHV